MKSCRGTAHFTLLIVAMSCGGCLALPIPHTRTAIPSISGQLPHAEHVVSAADARYGFYVGEELIENGDIVFNESGFFTIPETREWACWFYICLLPMDCVWSADFRIVDDGREIHRQQVILFPVGLNMLHLPKIDLGKIDGNNAPEEDAYDSLSDIVPE